ncbi:MAG: hypothetical protein DMF69_14710, partial [Acidobacteria bacterium]
MWLVVATGAANCIYATLTIPFDRIDIYFYVLAAVTAIIGSRIAIRIPQINANITVDDTFVFIALLVYGTEAAILLAALAGVCSALRISKKVRTVAFAGAALACAVLATGTVLRLVFGPSSELFSQGASVSNIGVCLMALVQYLTHTAIGAVASALKANEPVWRMWSRNFLWISISYFAGAVAAGFVVSSVGTARFWAVLISIPVIIIVYFSYDRYMREVKASARHAEDAERARAEIEHERAEQAERHVTELNNYIAEQ